ncbi:MAG: sugar phosphate isomerase/epimerase [Saprospiraceae bacterium]|nr:sugar phosphate isomerase/epimerase [Saprospiraceae bacterium]
MKRRNLLKNIASTAATASLVPGWKSLQGLSKKKNPAFTFCLNTSTLRGQEQGIVKDLETAAAAGYDGVEIWINAMQKYVEEGGTLPELKARIDDLGIQIEDAIGFAQWIDDDDMVREKAIEQLKMEMDMLAQIGCRRIAAPPAGATNEAGLNLDAAGERYARILEVGVMQGVIPQLEVWGFSKNLHKISQVLYVAGESGHPGARILPDIYHLYKGGSSFEALKMINGPTIEIFHMNDYPSDPPQETIKDSDRVYPGDGVAPVKQVLQDLYRPDATTVLSLELFNPNYWKQDALLVAKTGLQKMKMAAEGIG